MEAVGMVGLVVRNCAFIGFVFIEHLLSVR